MRQVGGGHLGELAQRPGPERGTKGLGRKGLQRIGAGGQSGSGGRDLSRTSPPPPQDSIGAAPVYLSRGPLPGRRACVGVPGGQGRLPVPVPLLGSQGCACLWPRSGMRVGGGVQRLTPGGSPGSAITLLLAVPPRHPWEVPCPRIPSPHFVRGSEALARWGIGQPRVSPGVTP